MEIFIKVRNNQIIGNQCGKKCEMKVGRCPVWLVQKYTPIDKQIVNRTRNQEKSDENQWKWKKTKQNRKIKISGGQVKNLGGPL